MASFFSEHIKKSHKFSEIFN